jgi:hypothetical protein
MQLASPSLENEIIELSETNRRTGKFNMAHIPIQYRKQEKEPTQRLGHQVLVSGSTRKE